MEQVSGRAGRKDAHGKVLIQVANTNHPVLQYVKAHDYKSFFAAEIAGRQQFAYPPYTRLIQITFKHKHKEIVTAAAAAFAEQLKPVFGKYITGPAEPVVNRVRNQYLMEMILKLPKDANLLARCREMIHAQEAAMHHHSSYKSVVMVVDVDAV